MEHDHSNPAQVPMFLDQYNLSTINNKKLSQHIFIHVRKYTNRLTLLYKKDPKLLGCHFLLHTYCITYVFVRGV